jgi:hypothetical protein
MGISSPSENVAELFQRKETDKTVNTLIVQTWVEESNGDATYCPARPLVTEITSTEITSTEITSTEITSIKISKTTKRQKLANSSR